MVIVKEGWFRDENEIFSEALRRFLETHQPELMEGSLDESFVLMSDD